MSRRGPRQPEQEAPSAVNVALVGAIGCGKSALTVRYITKRFINEYDPYLEDTYAKYEVLEDQEVCVRVMDTCDKGGADPERYLRWAHAYLIVYSITDPESFETAAGYMDAIAGHQGEAAPMVLVGNKSDLERYRQVSAWEGRRLAQRHEAPFFETSAAEGSWESVASVFREAARHAQEQTPHLQHSSLHIEENHGGDQRRRAAVEKGRKESRCESAPGGGLSPSHAGPRFSFLKGIAPLKGIFQSSSNGGASQPPASPPSPPTPS
ncbi:ras-like protein family member 12 [Ischnura elegans]|uniref:ras-like protein family member 12 n=1 Tax=Ischnura elegans TaxID=197161 RepID=UPI001ED88740|nr:ras-like protein family member 12 [Ischnura elegans]